MADEKRRKVDLKAAWGEARALVWERRRRLAAGLLLMLVGRLAGLVLPASSKLLIDDVVGKGRADLLVPIALAAGGATLLEAASSFALAMLLGVAAQRSITEARRRLDRHLLRLPVRAFDESKSGEMLSRVLNDAEGIRNLVGTGIVQLVGGLLTAGLAFGVLLWLNWRLTLYVLGALAAFAGLMFWAFTRLRPIFRERGKLLADLSGRLAESVGGIRVVKAYTAEKREERRFTEGVHAVFRNVASTMTAVAGVSSLTGVLIGVVGVILLLVGGHAILRGEMTLGDLVMYVFFTGLLAAPLVQVAAISTQLSEAFAGLDRMRELLSQEPETAGDDGRTALLDLTGTVEFEGVSFAYREGTAVLREVSFRAPAGSTTALVGPSGSGKSTLIRLVMAFDRPIGGRVLVDGHDLAAIRLADFRSRLGVVFQDNFLFDGTVAENIAYGDPRATREAIEAAGAVAHCDEFVTGFEKGYDTVVGERGVKLSGGQRQRVAIARAILADPAILILDEATSSLDSESEAMIQDGLSRLRKGRTTFVIAHRLSTIRSADQILVLEDGRIVERGTHRELMELAGRYRQLHDRQYRIENDLFVNPGEDFSPPPEAIASVPRRDGGGVPRD